MPGLGKPKQEMYIYRAKYRYEQVNQKQEVTVDEGRSRTGHEESGNTWVPDSEARIDLTN